MLRRGVTTLLMVALLAFGLGGTAVASSPGIVYGGRLTGADGAPLAGPVDLSFAFFDAATGGHALRGAPLHVRGVTLTQGVFQAELALTAADLDALFGGGGAVFVEVTDATHGKTYPRQRFGAVPYALRVPVDGTSIVYDNAGNLSVGSIEASKVTGLTADAAKLHGVPLGTGTPSAGQVLTYNGSAWVPAPATSTLAVSSLSGTLAPAQLPALSSLSGTLTPSQLPPLTASSLTGTLSAGQLPGLPASQITSGTLPTSVGGTGSNATLTGDRMLVSSGGAMVEAPLLSVVGGNLGIGTTSAVSALDVSGAFSERGINAPPVAPAGQGRIYFDATSSQFMVSQNGGAYAPLGTVTGGTITQISPGTGLSGGGTSGNVVLSLTNVGTAGSYTKVFTDANGRVTAGTTLVAADLPTITASMISGTLPTADLPTLTANMITGTLSVAQLPSLPAGQITSGTLGLAQLPAIPMTQLSGTLTTAQLPPIPTTQLSGTLSPGQIPSLDASKVTTGTFATALIPSLSEAQITSGTLAVALGGTGATSFTNNGVVIGGGAGPLSATAAGSQYQVLTVNGSGQPVFGKLNLDQSPAVNGVLAVANGGTGSGTALSNNRPMISSGGAVVEGPALTNGQLLVGSTGAAPVAATLAQGATQGVTVTAGAGSLTLDTAQDIRTSATPQFATVKLTTPSTGSLLKVGTGGTLTAAVAADLTSLVAGSYVQKTGDAMTGALTLPGNGLAVGGTQLVAANGYVGIGASSPSYPLDFQTTVTDWSNASSGIRVRPQSIATTSGTNYGIGIDVQDYVQRVDPGVNDGGYRLAIRADAYAYTTAFAGSLAAQYGIQARAGINTASPGAVVSNAFGVYAQILNAQSGATINNAYGVFIDDSQTTGTITNRYDLYASSTNARNYFAGTVGIGTPAPSSALDLSGALTVRSTATPALSSAGQGRLYFDSTANQLLVSQNGGAYAPISTLTALGSAGSYTKVTTDAFGRVTSGTTLSGSDIPPHSASLLTSGTVPLAQLPNIPTSQLTGTLAGSQIGAHSAALITTGTLSVAQGGTGASTLTANAVLLGNGTGAPSTVSPGTSGNVLTSNGTTWVSQGIPWSSPGAIGSTSANSGNFTGLTWSGNAGFGTTAPAWPLDIESTWTGTGSASYYAMTSVATASPSGPTSTIEVGAYHAAQSVGSADMTNGRLYGNYTIANHTAASTLGIEYGSVAIAQNGGSGTVLSAAAIRAILNNTSTGTIANAYGIYVSPPANGSTGAITNYYGLYLNQPTVATGANYPLYSVGGVNYFGGAVGIGTNNPDTKLDVNGSILSNLGTAMYHYRSLVSYTATGAVTGTMKISMPKLHSQTMLSLKISGYDYSNGAWEVLIGGYNYSTGLYWYHTSASITGRPPFNSIRLAEDGTSNVVLLGTPTTVWSYPKLEVTDLWTGNGSYSSWGSGWAVAPITDESAIVNVVSPPIDLFVATNGNVGIGTTSPVAALHVTETDNNTTMTGTTPGQVLIENTSSNGFYSSLDFRGNQSNPIARIGMLQTGSGTYLSLGTSNVFANGITNTAMTIGPTGKVGIGTATPGQALQVVGTIESTTGGFKFPDGSTQTTGGNVYKAYITNNGTTCAIASQNGSWLSSASRTGTGAGNLNIAAGTFSATPVCVCTAGPTGTYNSHCAFTGLSTSTISAIISNFGTASTHDDPFNIICM